VVGFFLQRQQLAENTEAIRAQLVEMRRAAEQAEVQSRAIEADELHSRQDTFLRIADMVNGQLATIGGFLVMSAVIEIGPDEMTKPGGGQELWARTGAGDHTAFSGKMFSLVYSDEMPAPTLFWGTEIRSNHTRNFMAAFDRLIEHARRCDPDGIIADAILDGHHGRIHRIMRESAPAG
jgi:hypothetical protein